jgi:hypothetical protein
VDHLERMKHGGGITDLDDKSKGMEILMEESFVKINPTDPFILAKQVARKKRKWIDSSGMSLSGMKSMGSGRSMYS